MESVFDLLEGLAGGVVVNRPLRKRECSFEVIVICGLSVNRSQLDVIMYVGVVS